MRRVSQLKHPLSSVFAVSSHLAILRALQDNREGLSGRAIAREAGINHQACAVALRKLEAIGVVKRQGADRTQLIRLNFDNYLVRDLILPLLRKERELLATMRKDIAEHFKQDALAISMFGSVARGEDAPGSDVDVLMVVKASKHKKEKLLQTADTYGANFLGRYGVQFSPLIMHSGELRERWKQGDSFLKNVLAEGVDLLPTRVADLVR
jgi:predicted nucleotidyltransferase